MDKRFPQRRFLEVAFGDHELARLLLDRCLIGAVVGDGLPAGPEGALDCAALPADLRVYRVTFDAESHRVRVILESDALPDSCVWKGQRNYRWVIFSPGCKDSARAFARKAAEDLVKAQAALGEYGGMPTGALFVTDEKGRRYRVAVTREPEPEPEVASA